MARSEADNLVPILEHLMRHMHYYYVCYIQLCIAYKLSDNIYGRGDA